jgi:hypothetical protein
MKYYITPEQIMALTPEAQRVLTDWFMDTIEWDDDQVRVYIPEERTADTDGVFEGDWDQECYFNYPEPSIGKLKNHEGTVLPLLDIGHLIELLDVCMQVEELSGSRLSGSWQMRHSSDSKQEWRVVTAGDVIEDSGFPELCDALWEAVKRFLEAK